MEREIEFRAKEKYGKQWIYGMLCYCWQDNLGIQTLNDMKSEESLISILEETICQYTGIKDAKGNKIFEGDIVEFSFTVPITNQKCCTQYLVKFDNGMFGTWYKDVTGEWIEDDRLSTYLIEMDKLEIIGNIFDTPELSKNIYEGE